MLTGRVCSSLPPWALLYLLPEPSLHRQRFSAACPLFSEQARSPTTTIEMVYRLWPLPWQIFQDSPALAHCAFQTWTDCLPCCETKNFISWRIPLCVMHQCVTLAQVLALPSNGVPGPCTLRRGVSLFRRFSIVHCLLSAESILSTLLDEFSWSPEAKSPK